MRLRDCVVGKRVRIARSLKGKGDPEVNRLVRGRVGAIASTEREEDDDFPVTVLLDTPWTLDGTEFTGVACAPSELDPIKPKVKHNRNH